MNRNEIKYHILITVACFILSDSALSETQLENTKSLENGPSLENQAKAFHDYSEVGGLIIDRTMTRLGEDFYSNFSQLLNDRYESLDENLTVTERPTALSGSIIGIYHRNKPIYRTALSPGKRQAQDRAEEALRVVSNYIIRWEAERLLQDTFDLDHDEI